MRDEDVALDVVQEAMMRLAEKYGDRPAAELPALFQRILQNAIRDHFRRQKTRSLWTTLFSAFLSEDDEESDALDVLAAESMGDTPPQHVEREQMLAIIEKELMKLPPRQREAFLMRYWHDMDIAETAAAMGCTEGSVKTHCFRATHALAAALKAKGIEP